MIKKLRVTVDGHPYDVIVELPEEPGAAPAAASPQPSAAQLAPVSVPVPAPTPAPPPPARTGGGPGDVPSPLAGRVTAIMVQVGQAVKENDHLLTLEAMKMNTFVFAPAAGKVVQMNTTVGAAVEEGQVLLRVE
jgi:glutaconyl-CoA/methylmalonyl-CoA decarboxylase subunit gamma